MRSEQSFQDSFQTEADLVTVYDAKAEKKEKNV